MKINCINPSHVDKTPSMHLYEDGAHCFVCGYYCGLDQVTNEVTIEEIQRLKKQAPENIEAALSRIDSLPKKEVRGFNLPCDESGTYLVWPDRSYYKLRRFDDKPRYIGPKGHRAPLFVIAGSKTTLVVVEGEYNALSLKEVYKKDGGPTIVSPGSASELNRHTRFYLQFQKIYVIVDRDAAGVANGVRLREDLKKKGKRVVLIALEEDFNDMLQRNGKEEIKKRLKEELGIKT